MVFLHEERTDPSSNNALQQAKYDGVIKFAMSQCFESSSEEYTTVTKKPHVGVTVTDKFNTNQMLLSCLTRTLTFVANDGTRAKQPPESNLVFKDLFKNEKGQDMHAIARSDLRWPAERATLGSARAETVENLVAFWACKEVADVHAANSIHDKKTVHVKIGDFSMDVNVPIIKNTKPLKAGDEVLVLKRETAAMTEGDEPPHKKHKGGGKGNANPKAKAKAKIKAKSKPKAKCRP